MKLRRVQPQVIAVAQSCCRCAVEFRSAERVCLCPTCKQERRPTREGGNVGLSPRERQVVSLVAQAKANKEIANALNLSEGTVKEYLHTIFRKVGVRNRTELALRATSRQPEMAA